MKRTALRKIAMPHDPNNPRGWKGKPSPEYSVWWAMLDRCRNPRSQSYRYYGGRGIRVCLDWEEFDRFFISMGKRPSPFHTLERINNNGDYRPNNCRWATRKEQSRNKNNNRVIIAFGESKTLADWLSDNRCAVKSGALRYRLKNNLFGTTEKNLTTPKYEKV